MIAGLYAAFGVVTALQARHRTGKGQNVESSLTKWFNQYDGLSIC